MIQKFNDWIPSNSSKWLWMSTHIANYFHHRGRRTWWSLSRNDPTSIPPAAPSISHIPFKMVVSSLKTQTLPPCDRTFSFHCLVLEQPQHSVNMPRGWHSSITAIEAQWWYGLLFLWNCLVLVLSCIPRQIAVECSRCIEKKREIIVRLIFHGLQSCATDNA